jgi:2-isopropylmalate synthase
LIKELFDTVPNINKAVISVHCHNDLGLAVANSIAAVQNGARAVECTINGLGERAGNCALEEFVMALRTRHDAFGLTTGIDVSRIRQISNLVSSLTGISVQRNKAIVGANAFAHESGIHQDGMLKHRETYEIMRPEDVGYEGTELVLGKHSGRHAFRNHMERLGFKLAADEIEKAYERFIKLADKKKNVYDDDLIAIVRDELEQPLSVYTLEHLQVSTGTSMVPTATVRLRKADDVIEDAACGDGPVDAALKTIDRITGVSGRLLDFNLQAVTRGKDALGEVSLRVEFNGSVNSAKAASTDIVEASAKAYLSCVNRYLSVLSPASEAPAKKSGKSASRKKPAVKRKSASNKKASRSKK